MPDEPKKKRHRIPKKGSEIRKSRTYLIEVDRETAFRLRRIDLFGMFIEGVLPMPLFAAVDRIQNIRRNVGDEEALKTITNDELGTMKEIIRRVAVAVVVEPKMTHSKQEARDLDLVWVGGKSDLPGEEHLPEQHGDVSSTTLMQVYKAANNEAGVVVLSDDDAEEFRPGEPADTHDALGHESGVSPSPVVVDLHAGTPPVPDEDATVVREWKGYH